MGQLTVAVAVVAAGMTVAGTTARSVAVAAVVAQLAVGRNQTVGTIGSCPVEVLLGK